MLLYFAWFISDEYSKTKFVFLTFLLKAEVIYKKNNKNITLHCGRNIRPIWPFSILTCVQEFTMFLPKISSHWLHLYGQKNAFRERYRRQTDRHTWLINFGVCFWSRTYAETPFWVNIFSSCWGLVQMNFWYPKRQTTQNFEKLRRLNHEICIRWILFFFIWKYDSMCRSVGPFVHLKIK